MSGNAHDDLNISFEDSYDDYDDDSVKVTVTEHSSKGNVNVNESLSNLKDIKLKNINRVMMAQLNINSRQNTFDFLKGTVASYVEMLLITAGKIVNSFLTATFQKNGFGSLYRLDRNAHGEGILLYVTEDIPSKHLKGSDFEGNVC